MGGITLVVALFCILKIFADYISANYKDNPKIREWVIKQSQKDGKELSELEKEQIENILGK
jgi:hypothetical protein